jgi:hypothetical protein
MPATDVLYGLGRLAFGTAVMAAPAAVGRTFLGDDARQPSTRSALRIYGTRDVVLGTGTLRAAASGGHVGP